jgi:UDP-glucose 4-epimerase
MLVLVTGATGFLGSYVVRDLLDRGHEVAVLLRPASDRSRLAGVIDRATPVVTDLSDVDLGDLRPDAVVHLAWEGVAGAARDDDAQERNVANTERLLDASADAGATTFVGAGSQAEYGPRDDVISEDAPTAPTTQYGRAKVAALEASARTCAERGIRFAWLRVFSTYGPTDNPHWLIPTTIEALRAGKAVPLTAGEQQWGFLHARDAAAAFGTVVDSPGASGIFNVGSPDAPRLRDTLVLLRDLTDPSGVLELGAVPYRPDQVMRLQADVSRLRALGWSPRVDLEVGLRETIDWHDATHRRGSL